MWYIGLYITDENYHVLVIAPSGEEKPIRKPQSNCDTLMLKLQNWFYIFHLFFFTKSLYFDTNRIKNTECFGTRNTISRTADYILWFPVDWNFPFTLAIFIVCLFHEYNIFVQITCFIFGAMQIRWRLNIGLLE